MDAGPTPDPPNELWVDIVADEQALDALRDEWDEAAAADPHPNVFLTWEWVRTWWAHFGTNTGGRADGARAGAELHIVVVRDADGVVAIAPLQRTPACAGPLRTRLLQRIAPEAGDYGGVVLARRPDEAVAALVHHLHGELRDGRASAVVLSRLASDDPFLDLLREVTAPRAGPLDPHAVGGSGWRGRVARLRRADGADRAGALAPRDAPRASHGTDLPCDDGGPRRRVLLASRSGVRSSNAGDRRRRAPLAWNETVLGGACPFTDLRQGFDLAKQTKKHKVRQRLRRLGERHDDVTFTRHRGGNLEEGVDRLLQVHGRRWADRAGDLQGLLAEPAAQAFLLDAVRALDARSWVNLLTLTADGRPVAAELDFAYRGRVVMFKGAFDPDYAAFSPGQLLHHQVFQDAVADGVDVVDFGRGDQPYKRRWANGERHLVTVTLTPAGLAGRLARHRLRVVQALARHLGRAARTP